MNKTQEVKMMKMKAMIRSKKAVDKHMQKWHSAPAVEEGAVNKFLQSASEGPIVEGEDGA